jgi:hypothetical protein
MIINGDEVEFYSKKTNKVLKGIAKIELMYFTVTTKKGYIYLFSYDGYHIAKTGNKDFDYLLLHIRGIDVVAMLRVSSLYTHELNIYHQLKHTFKTEIPGYFIELKTHVNNTSNVCSCPMRELLMYGCKCTTGQASLAQERNKYDSR